MATKQSTSFTVRETELLTIAFQCLKERPNIDCEVMASKANYKGAKSARDSFNQLYNKIVSGEKSSSSNGEAKEQSDEPSPKKMTPSKRKAADGVKEEDDEENASPTKKKKTTPSKSKGKKKPVTEDEEVVDQAGDDA